MCGSLTTVIFVLSSIVFLTEQECSLVFLHPKSYHTGFSASTYIESYQTLILAIGCFEVIIATLTYLPFLLRIRGVSNDSTPIVIFFSILWVIQFLSALVLPLGIGAAHTQ